MTGLRPLATLGTGPSPQGQYHFPSASVGYNRWEALIWKALILQKNAVIVYVRTVESSDSHERGYINCKRKPKIVETYILLIQSVLNKIQKVGN